MQEFRLNSGEETQMSINDVCGMQAISFGIIAALAPSALVVFLVLITEMTRLRRSDLTGDKDKQEELINRRSLK